MGRIYWEILFITLVVIFATIFVYGRLANWVIFWDSQFIWSVALIICWGVVTLGYYHQGWLVYTSKSADHVSIVLPVSVFIVQCILFVKGIYYVDWSLVSGAVMVNSGVTFSLYQIIKNRKK